MSRLLRCWIMGIAVCLFQLTCWAQGGGEQAARKTGATAWRVFGWVLTAHADPLNSVDVQLDLGLTSAFRRSVKTNLQGEFQIEIKADSVKSARLSGTVVASKTGYSEGHASFDIGLEEKPKGIVIILQESNEDPNRLSMSALVRALAPQLRENAAKSVPEESGRKELVRGCEQLINARKAVAAVPLLKVAVKNAPDCLDCRLLLSLALLSAGNWSDAEIELGHAVKINTENSLKRPEPDLLMGVIHAWKGHGGDAVRSFQQALEADSGNILALQELGRILVAMKNWEAADTYLEKALQAGAGDAARLLRVQALLELGDVAEAAREMDLYTAGRDIKDLTMAARVLSSQVQDRLTLISYQQVRSVITQSPEELIKVLPNLQGLRAATDPSMLQEVLQKTGEGVDAFFKNLPNTASLEHVRQERLGKEGKVKNSLDQQFQYLMLVHPDRPGLGIEEIRSTIEGQDAALVGLHKGLMLTSGFASASSIFHPVNRDGADFRYLGMQDVEGHEAHVIAFAQKPETAKMVTRFVTDKTTALILVQGVAWVDAKSFHILRLQTGLLNPLPKIRLQKQTTEIRYQPVDFNGGSTTLWLPREVDVLVDWRGRVLHNQHLYSDFKLFNVDAREEGKPRQLNAVTESEHPKGN